MIAMAVVYRFYKQRLLAALDLWALHIALICIVAIGIDDGIIRAFRRFDVGGRKFQG